MYICLNSPIIIVIKPQIELLIISSGRSVFVLDGGGECEHLYHLCFYEHYFRWWDDSNSSVCVIHLVRVNNLVGQVVVGWEGCPIIRSEYSNTLCVALHIEVRLVDYYVNSHILEWRSICRLHIEGDFDCSSIKAYENHILKEVWLIICI